MLVAREAARLHGLALPGSGWDVIGPLLAKRAQIEAARRAGVPVPPTWFADDRAAAERAAAELRYPAIVKPSVGIAFKAREGRPVLEADGPDELLAAWERGARGGRRPAAAGGRARRRRRAVDGRLLHERRRHRHAGHVQRPQAGPDAAPLRHL